MTTQDLMHILKFKENALLNVHQLTMLKDATMQTCERSKNDVLNRYKCSEPMKLDS